ncbi:sigma-70 family RNA polymerase sigma factor [bacterium]|nr:sigma-70 family RNA polymerase sigma factor [bacterium]
MADESRDDAAFLEAVRRGDAAAFDQFVERFGPMILAFGMRSCGRREDAEDVFQETLVKVFTQLRGLENPGALKTWLWRVVANECLMSRRGPRDPARSIGIEDLRPPGSDAPVEFADPRAASPEGAAIAAEERARVEAALRNLSPDHRIIVLLRDFEGLRTAEVADVLGITEANAKVRLHRARTALRAELAAGPEERR